MRRVGDVLLPSRAASWMAYLVCCSGFMINVIRILFTYERKLDEEV